jgi:multidrug resistance efflux pump
MSERLDNSHSVSAPVSLPSPSVDGGLSLKDRVRSLRLPENQSRQRSSRSWLPWLLCLALAGLCGYLGYNTYFANEARPEPDKPPASNASIEQPTTPAEKPIGKVALTAGGYIIPMQKVQVSPKVGGEVMEWRKIDGRELREGDRVEKGEWLARLDRIKYEFEYERTSALAAQALAEYEKLQKGNRDEEKEQAKAALIEAEHHRDQLYDQVTRLRRSRSASSAEELVRVESQFAQADAKVEQLRQASILMNKGWREEEVRKAKAAYEHAKAQQANAKYDLDNTEVRAPITGIILAKKAEVGNTVRPEAFSNGLSASLCDMADLRLLEVDVDVSERDLNSVFQGQKCEIRTEAPSDTVYKGEVARLMPEANRSKASVAVRVRIEVPPGDQHLRPEMRARVNFLAREKETLSSK